MQASHDARIEARVTANAAPGRDRCLDLLDVSTVPAHEKLGKFLPEEGDRPGAAELRKVTSATRGRLRSGRDRGPRLLGLFQFDDRNDAVLLDPFEPRSSSILLRSVFSTPVSSRTLASFRRNGIGHRQSISPGRAKRAKDSLPIRRID